MRHLGRWPTRTSPTPTRTNHHHPLAPPPFPTAVPAPRPAPGGRRPHRLVLLRGRPGRLGHLRPTLVHSLWLRLRCRRNRPRLLLPVLGPARHHGRLCRGADPGEQQPAAPAPGLPGRLAAPLPPCLSAASRSRRRRRGRAPPPLPPSLCSARCRTCCRSPTSWAGALGTWPSRTWCCSACSTWPSVSPGAPPARRAACLPRTASVAGAAAVEAHYHCVEPEPEWPCRGGGGRSSLFLPPHGRQTALAPPPRLCRVSCCACGCAGRLQSLPLPPAQCQHASPPQTPRAATLAEYTTIGTLFGVYLGSKVRAPCRPGSRCSCWERPPNTPPPACARLAPAPASSRPRLRSLGEDIARQVRAAAPQAGAHAGAPHSRPAGLRHHHRHRPAHDDLHRVRRPLHLHHHRPSAGCGAGRGGAGLAATAGESAHDREGGGAPGAHTLDPASAPRRGSPRARCQPCLQAAPRARWLPRCPLPLRSPPADSHSSTPPTPHPPTPPPPPPSHTHTLQASPSACSLASASSSWPPTSGTTCPSPSLGTAAPLTPRATSAPVGRAGGAARRDGLAAEGDQGVQGLAKAGGSSGLQVATPGLLA